MGESIERALVEFASQPEGDLCPSFSSRVGSQFPKRPDPFCLEAPTTASAPSPSLCQVRRTT